MWASYPPVETGGYRYFAPLGHRYLQKFTTLSILQTCNENLSSLKDVVLRRERKIAAVDIIFETMRIRLFLETFLPNFLAEDRRVVPSETQFRVGSIPAKGPERFRSILVVVEKNVTFRAFDES